MTEDTPITAAPQPRTAVQRVTVGAEDAGQRLDKVLARLLPQVPRSHLYRLLRKGEVRVNGKRPSGEQRLAEGDELRIPPVRIEAPDPVAPGRKPVPRHLVEQIEAAIVYKDERLLVVDKPAGVAVHGGSGISFGVIEALRASRPDEDLELVHRLDRDTSGCLLVARRRSSLRALHALLRADVAPGPRGKAGAGGSAGNFDKRYLVLLKGKWELGAKLIDAPLNVEARVSGERTVRVDARGKPAASQFKVVQFFGRLATLVEVQLLTGRTHQIRVHAAHAGHPVAGDEKYGDPEFNAQLRQFGLGRMFLHAHSISYPDAERRVEVSVSAPLPDELKKVLDELTGVAARNMKPAGPRVGQQLVREPRSPRPAARRKARSTAGR